MTKLTKRELLMLALRNPGQTIFWLIIGARNKYKQIKRRVRWKLESMRKNGLVKRSFTRMDVLLSVVAGALLMLGLGLLVVDPENAVYQFVGSAGLIGLVFWPEVDGGKEGGE